MRFRLVHQIILILLVSVALVQPGWGGNKKIMTTRAAKVMAERALVESIYGLKIRATETVQDMVAASFSGEVPGSNDRHHLGRVLLIAFWPNWSKGILQRESPARVPKTVRATLGRSTTQKGECKNT